MVWEVVAGWDVVAITVWVLVAPPAVEPGAALMTEAPELVDDDGGGAGTRSGEINARGASPAPPLAGRAPPACEPPASLLCPEKRGRFSLGCTFLRRRVSHSSPVEDFRTGLVTAISG